jgi:hypothetical protein
LDRRCSWQQEAAMRTAVVGSIRWRQLAITVVILLATVLVVVVATADHVVAAIIIIILPIAAMVMKRERDDSISIDIAMIAIDS